MLFCFETFADQIGKPDCNSDWAFRHLLDTLAERDGAAAAETAISAARVDYEWFDALLVQIAEDEGSLPADRTPPDRAGVERLLEQRRGIPPFWWKTASADDLRWLADKLVMETDDQTIAQILPVFRKCDFPGPIARLFTLTENATRRVRMGLSGRCAG